MWRAQLPVVLVHQNGQYHGYSCNSREACRYTQAGCMHHGVMFGMEAAWQTPSPCLHTCSCHADNHPTCRAQLAAWCCLAALNICLRADRLRRASWVTEQLFNSGCCFWVFPQHLGEGPASPVSQRNMIQLYLFTSFRYDCVLLAVTGAAIVSASSLWCVCKISLEPDRRLFVSKHV